MRQPTSNGNGRFITVIAYLGIIGASLWFAFLLRFDFAPPRSEIGLLWRGITIALPLKELVFYLTGLQRRRWGQYVGMIDLVQVFASNVLASTLFTIATLVIIGPSFPRSVYCLDLLLCFLLTSGFQFAVRVYREGLLGFRRIHENKRVLIHGAGIAGAMLARELRANPQLGYTVEGFLDDDLTKHGSALVGLPVLGSGRDLGQILETFNKRHKAIQEVFISLPSATRQQVRKAVACCRSAGIACRTVPGLMELITGKVHISQVRQICVNDLLGREPVRLDEDSVRRATKGRSVLVTGAAGSIGSELCRQLASYSPRILVAFDQAESELFKLDTELRKEHPSLNIVAEVGDVRDRDRIDETVRYYSVESMFHAAAYKHVPLMEYQVHEAMKNNVLGTWNAAQSAFENGVSNFVLISSDKAVNPTSIMGATKRVGELIISAMPPSQGESGTKFVAVRFGNVLVSNGSVVPIFQKQIAAGGPVTVTHPEVCRYFMTVQEAVQLVLQASTMGQGSEIFVLDMGEPIRIMDLARNMIRLSGLVPDEDIKIRVIGLRPGEKLFEELNLQNENTVPTLREKIRVFQGPRANLATVQRWIQELESLLRRREKQAVIEHLRRVVPEYRPDALQRDSKARQLGQTATASRSFHSRAQQRLYQVFPRS